MTIERFTKTAGNDTVLTGVDDPTMLLLGAPGCFGVPSNVSLPADVGGGVRDVVRGRMAPCPCKGGHNSRHLDLAGGISVAECLQFYWYKTPSDLL